MIIKSECASVNELEQKLMKGLSFRKKGSTDVCADGKGADGPLARPKGFSLRRWDDPQDVSVSGTNFLFLRDRENGASRNYFHAEWRHRF
ncbi:hypothetical protein NPIL_548041 [Nephila pilipes]|uniref:Uncharacterized protein n=1 Tax=Nephila pilipes TaxID=299642 RepID=A0A8X6U843_NEPPI|nr:hypothetical protein NPIL_548041 [Nephila pilipes]